ncbi:MAG: NUDIX domain-containing protein [Clostridia bacterium]|nr:NUDIX domain-containing protein [Clostridia bacterium]
MKEIIICAPDHEKKFSYSRETCRGIIIKDNEILMSHEKVVDCWTLPGGGVEDGESREICCAREVLEETGFIVEIKEFFKTVTEYYDNARYTHHYYLCDIVGEGERNPTPYEIQVDAQPEWINIDKLMKRFEQDFDKTGENHRVHLRDHTLLTEYLKRYN